MPFPKHLPQPRLADRARIPRLRWGIVGPGWIAERFAASLRADGSQDLVAVQSSDGLRAKAFAERFAIPRSHDGQGMLADREVDVVYVASVHHRHIADALAAIEAGKHVLVEKPLALNASEGRRLADAARERGVFLMEAYWTDFLPKFDVIRRLLADGAIGRVHTVLADHGEWFAPGHRILRRDLAGGPMLDLGTYPVSLATSVLGPAERVLASGEPAPGGEVNGQASMLLTHAGGGQSVLHTTLLSHTPCEATIAGDGGMIAIPGSFFAPGPFTVTANDLSTRLVFEEPRNRYDQLFHQAVHLASCVGEGLLESPIRPLAASLAALEAMDAARAQIGALFDGEAPAA